VEQITRRPEGGFRLRLGPDRTLTADRVLLATGGCRAAAAGGLAVSLGHTLEPPVPSLFTFQIEVAWLRQLAGVSVPEVEVMVADQKLRATGPLLVTHWGLSGPAILKLSAWSARELQALDYRFTLVVNWLSGWTPERLSQEISGQRARSGGRALAKAALGGLPARLWERLVASAGISPALRWAELSKPMEQSLIGQLRAMSFPVTGKSLNKDEFVTCGGVRLPEVDFKRMESRVCPGLHLAGEVLDIDGLTGGFNFQAAWTTGWIAGRAMAGL
jgi:predicted Rossmann fold flavoprotein